MAGVRRRWLAVAALVEWVGASSTGCEKRAQEVRSEAELRQAVQQMMPAVELATRLPREGGRIVALGIAGEGRELCVPADRFVLRDVELIGSVGYTTAVWSRVVELLGAGLVDVAPILTHRFAAERFEDAFRLMVERDGIVGKVLLEHRGA